MSIREPRPGVRISPPGPVDGPAQIVVVAAPSSTAVSRWIGIGLVIALILLNEVQALLPKFPQTQGVIIAGIVIGGLIVVIPQIQAAVASGMAQLFEHREVMAEQQQVHDLAMERLRAQARQTLTAGTAR